MSYSEKLRYSISYSVLSVCVAAAITLPAYAEESWVHGCEVAVAASPCQQPFHQGLAAVALGAVRDQQASWGFIDPAGKMVIPPVYREVRGFVNGLAAVKKQDAFAYIDKKGHEVIPARFSQATDFNAQGTALVTLDNRLVLIDRHGALVKTLPASTPITTPGFVDGNGTASVLQSVPSVLWNAETGRALSVPEDVQQLSTAQSIWFPALARVGNEGSYWGYLDENGQWAVEPQKLKARNLPLLNGEWIAVKNKNDWSFYSRQNDTMGKEIYRSVRALRDGYWLVTDNNNAQQLLDAHLAKVADVAPDHSEDIQYWADWLILSGSKGVMMVGPGNKIVELSFNNPQLLPRGDHLLVTQESADKNNRQLVQVYDIHGQPVLSDVTLHALQAYQLQVIAQSQQLGEPGSLPWAILQPAQNNTPPAILTSQGTIYTDPQWHALEFNSADMLVRVHTLDNHVGTINAQGQWSITPQFKQIGAFSGNYGWALLSDAKGDNRKIIDRAGNIIDVPAPVLQSAQSISNGMLLTAQDDNGVHHWSMWNLLAKSVKGSEAFAQIEPYVAGYALAQQSSGWGVVDGQGHWVILPEHAEKPQWLGAGIYLVEALHRDATTSATPRYAMLSVDNGQPIASELLSKPLAVGPDHWLIEPATGGVALIDQHGRTLLSKAIRAASTQVNGLWLTLTFTPHYALLNAQGEWKSEAKYVEPVNFVDPEHWASAQRDQHSELINANGAEPLPELHNAQPLNAMARIEADDVQSHESVLYDMQGQEIQRYSGTGRIVAMGAGEGIVPLKADNNLYGYIDAQGRKVIGAYFEQAAAMNNNRAAVVKASMYGQQWGYINQVGVFSILPRYEWAGNFSENRAWVSHKGQIQLISPDGSVQAAFALRCNQRVLLNQKGRQLWPEKTLNCANNTQAGGAQ